MLACCERRFAEFTEYVREAMAGQDDLVQALRELGRAYVRWGLERPEPYRILFMNPHPAGEELEDLPGMDGFFLLVAAVQGAMETGAMREADPILVAVGLWTVVHGITSLLVAMRSQDHPDHFPRPDTDALSDHQIDVQLRGLGA
ncbi:MAG TPA: TetR-like C-terminal domain-containing protein [Egibacteraceae bacterium]|nr:TetR-like C-terminal domain-containing protein [Egibacteraceae bacterium]